MKKSVVNQFEKVLRNKFSCWKETVIEREDSKGWTTFYVEDTLDNTTLYSAQIKRACEVQDAFNVYCGESDVTLMIETKTHEGDISWTKPVIVFLISTK